MDIKERIINQAKSLFMKLGIRSVSMDDICSQLGISKKTIYQHFKDKDELVDIVLQEEITFMQHETLGCCSTSIDAVDEIFKTMQLITKQMGNMNPVVLVDLHKYHFTSFQQFMQHKNTFLLDIISKNLKRGIEEGYYRQDLQVEILARYRLESMILAFNMDIFPTSRYNLAEVSIAIIENFLYGLATEKGFKLIEAYKQKSISNHA
jgi:AcrR family transcriptional regulator